jgi:hypothetical protein
MALPLLSIYWGGGVWAKSFWYCYLGGKFESQKSCEMQTICSIMKEIRAVKGMARNRNF